MMSSMPFTMARIGNGPERRRHPRCRVLERQLVTVDMGALQQGILVDVSVAGAAVQPYFPLQAGSTSKMYFAVPGEHELVEAEGIVTWVSPSGRAGIRFVKISESGQQSLQRWVENTDAHSRNATSNFADVTAAYLPPSYSPWIKIGDMNINQELLEEDLSSLDLVSALRMVVERARALTRAAGSVLALADGIDFVCRARSGIAPDLGARFSPDSGLSGQAVRSASIAICNDAQHDGRVDQVACQRLNLGSIAIVPILAGKAVVGVIEVFSSTESAFSDRDVANLQQLAELTGAILDHGAEPKPATTSSASAMNSEVKSGSDIKEESAEYAGIPTTEEITEIYSRMQSESKAEDRQQRKKILLSCLLAAVLIGGGFGASRYVRNQREAKTSRPQAVGLSTKTADQAGASIAPEPSAVTQTSISETNSRLESVSAAPQASQVTTKSSAPKKGRSSEPTRWTWHATQSPNHSQK